MKKSKYYVYIYYDPRTNVPIYVGKGKKGSKRHEHHLSTPQNKLLSYKLEKIRRVGLQPIIAIVVQNLSHTSALNLERILVSKFGRIDLKTGTLCNHTAGGDGTEGYKHKPMTIALFQRQRNGRKQTKAQYLANCSRRQSKRSRKLISNATKGHQRHTSGQIAALVNYNKTRLITDKMRSKWSKTRLNHTPTKAKYPSNEKLLQMIKDMGSLNKVAKHLGITWPSLSKYLKRRNLNWRVG